MPNPSDELTAVSLKAALWDTLRKVRSGDMDPATADSVAVQSREIIRTTRVQLAIMREAKRPVSQELEDFAMPKGL